MRTPCSLVLLVSVLACRTAEPAAVTTPAPATLPSIEQALQPAPGGLPDDDVVYDHRGAHGPLRLEQVAVDLDTATLRCRRVPARGELQEVQVVLDAEQVAFLQAQRDALVATPPADARRSALVHDLGVVTLTLRKGEAASTLVVDGAKTLEPYPDTLLARLVELKQTCKPAAASAPAAAP
jgi:hypothetical protein